MVQLSARQQRHAVGLLFWSSDEQSKLDFPAWPVHPSHHAPHRVPPQDGDAQVLASDSVLHHLAVVISSPFVEGQSVMQLSQVPQQARIGDDD